MDSTNKNNNQETTTDCNKPKPSIDLLRKAKSSLNISLAEQTDNNNTITAIIPEMSNSQSSSTIIEAKLPNDHSHSTHSAIIIKTTTKQSSTTKAGDTTQDESLSVRKISNRNQSDIFSLNKTEDNNSFGTMYSVRGAPSRKQSSSSDNKSSSGQFNREKHTMSQELQQIELEAKSSKSINNRNPVTGMGVNSNDEFIIKPIKRRGMTSFVISLIFYNYYQ